MSNNLSRIVDITIELQKVVSSGANFDTILIVGPAPKNPGESAPPDVGIYTSIDEVNEAGWISEGADADPVGTAARVAFGQTTKPSQIYIAVQKSSEAAVKAAVVIAGANAAIEQYAGKKDGLTGCTIAFNQSARKLSLVLTGPAAEVKNTGLFDMLAAMNADGYTVKIGGTAVVTGADFKALPVFKELAAMSMGDEPIDIAAVVSGADGGEVTYAVSVSYPDPDAPAAESVDEDVPLDEPELELESPNLTLSRAEEENGWYMALAAGIPEEKLEVMAEWTESREKMFGYAYATPGKNPVSAVYYRSFGVCYGETDDTIPADPYMHVAIAVRFLSYDAGSETWVNKALSSVNVSKFSSTIINALEAEPASYYIKVGDTGLVQGGKVRAGEWIDVIRFRDWLKDDMQKRVLNVLVKNSKIPYTDKGIGLVHNQMIASLKEGNRRGGIADDAYNSEGELIPGFTTSVPLAADLSDEQKASRKLINCKFSAILAGAIHAVKVNGSLVYSY